MKKSLLFTALAAIVTACGSHPAPETAKPNNIISVYETQPGDSTRYGLACDGCTDSILVFLPYTGGDPDTFDILNCRQQHRMLGHPHIGDALAVITSSDNPGEAHTVINMSTLDGEWCHMVEPTLRTIDGKVPPLPDSIRRKLLVPVEYMLRLKSDHTATAMGAMRRGSRDQSPAIYPTVTRYTDWHLFNGRLILHADTIAGFTRDGDKPATDTADIVLLMRDSLILRFSDHEQAFYRKKNN